MEIKHFIVGPLLTNCYLLISEGEAAVIDPGGGAKAILKEIEESKAKLKYIILTHGHWDHTLSVLKIKGKTGAKILIHEAEKEFVKPAPYRNKVSGTGFKVDQFLKEGDEIKIGTSLLKVIHTPGHTKGSISLLGKDFIFTGDTIFKDGYGRTDLKGGSQKDLENSLKKLEKILKPGMKVYPGHGETFEIK
jgi:glyoxylase-like metal-dependent hydrolase (beta-lactamase superfamily II)